MTLAPLSYSVALTTVIILALIVVPALIYGLTRLLRLRTLGPGKLAAIYLLQVGSIVIGELLATIYIPLVLLALPLQVASLYYLVKLSVWRSIAFSVLFSVLLFAAAAGILFAQLVR